MRFLRLGSVTLSPSSLAITYSPESELSLTISTCSRVAVSSKN